MRYDFMTFLWKVSPVAAVSVEHMVAEVGISVDREDMVRLFYYAEYVLNSSLCRTGAE